MQFGWEKCIIWNTFIWKKLTEKKERYVVINMYNLMWYIHQSCILVKHRNKMFKKS